MNAAKHAHHASMAAKEQEYVHARHVIDSRAVAAKEEIAHQSRFHQHMVNASMRHSFDRSAVTQTTTVVHNEPPREFVIEKRSTPIGEVRKMF